MDLEKIYQRIIKKTKPIGDCVYYRGSLEKDGYGIISVMENGVSKRYSTHRTVYMYNKGEIPKGLVVMHSCDNPSCCKIEHLSIGTHRDNIRDAISKGRHSSLNKKLILGSCCSHGHLLSNKTLGLRKTGNRTKSFCKKCESVRASIRYQKKKQRTNP